MKLITVSILLCLLVGCAKIQYMDELLALKSYSDNQDAQKRYLEREERKFQRLLADIKAERLSKGRYKSSIISAYGEPILTSPVKNDPVIIEELMYRHPAQLLGSEKAFLYFDQKQKLVKTTVTAARPQE